MSYPPYPPPQLPPGQQPGVPTYHVVQHVVAPRPPASALAITGFIFSLIWGCGVLSVVGLILSLMGLSDTRYGRKGGRGLAIAGVVLGAIGSAYFAFFGIAWIASLAGAA